MVPNTLVDCKFLLGMVKGSQSIVGRVQFTRYSAQEQRVQVHRFQSLGEGFMGNVIPEQFLTLCHTNLHTPDYCVSPLFRYNVFFSHLF